MGTKYRPSIKDQKATQRFHRNGRLKVANAAVKASFFLPQKSPIPPKGESPQPKKSPA
jgi:hypothetical protein